MGSRTLRIACHRTLIAGYCVVLVTLAILPALADAYNDYTHRRIVAEAVEFIISAAQTPTSYVDGSTAAADYRLIRKKLLGSSSGDDRRLRNRAQTLGNASAATDRRTDVWLKFPGLLWSSYQAEEAGIYFTLFSHFVNVKTPGVIFPDGGYSYGWVNANQKCSDPALEDHIANIFIGHTTATLDTDKSDAVIIYRDPLLPQVTREEYLKRLAQRVKFIHFWPATNVATHWFGAFVKSPRSPDHTPANLDWLGPVIHVAADATVPYHATGLSGCGHGPFEEMTERLHRDTKLYDEKLVREYLKTRKYLDAGKPVADIVRGAAIEASRHCSCSLGSCDCPIARDEKVAREMVNLAIASTVVVLRKALKEWAPDGATSRAGAPPTRLAPPQDVDPREPFYTGPRRSNSLLEILRKRPKVAAAEVEVAAAMEGRLEYHLNTLWTAVLLFATGLLEERGFRSDFEGAVREIAATVISFPQVQWNPMPHEVGEAQGPGLSPLGELPVRFRLPTLNEVRNAEAWDEYRNQRRRFFDALGLYHTGVKRGAAEGRKKFGSADAQGQVDEFVQALKGLQELYIASLIRGRAGRR